MNITLTALSIAKKSRNFIVNFEVIHTYNELIHLTREISLILLLRSPSLSYLKPYLFISFESYLLGNITSCFILLSILLYADFFLLKCSKSSKFGYLSVLDPKFLQLAIIWLFYLFIELPRGSLFLFCFKKRTPEKSFYIFSCIFFYFP
jgi:hypothetical protein